MADPSSAASSRPDPQGADESHGFARLSRRIAGWTTNGLATGLVLLAGLTIGRQVLVWWKESPPAAANVHREPALDSRPRQIEFAALATTVQSQEVRGTRSDAILALRNLCRPSARPPAPASASADAAERKLLAELSSHEPAERGDGWRLDEFPQGLPLVICSTSVERNSFPSSPSDVRIVAIGLAMPRDRDEWTAYAFGVDGAARQPPPETLPLPAGSVRGLALRQPDGLLLAAFSGRGAAEDWERHFRTRPGQEGWQILGQPPAAGRRWQAQFAKPRPKSLRADVHFEYDGQGGLHGLVLVSPAGEP